MNPSLQTIEREVSSLSPSELDEFSNWFASFYNEQWDNQLHADSATGHLKDLAANALMAFKQGQCTDL